MDKLSCTVLGVPADRHAFGEDQQDAWKVLQAKQQKKCALAGVICSVGGMDLLERFVTLWVVIDPIGTIPVFIAVTAGLDAAARRSTAFMATLVSAGVLLFFLVFGQILIDALGISLLSFQVAGGIVLFLFALSMIFGEPKPEQDLSLIHI